jgi:hypothetical protein
MAPRSGVTVGIHEGAGIHTNSTTGDTVATIGAKNHFGLGNVPARPWLDVGVDKAADEIARMYELAEKHGWSEQETLNAIGKAATDSVQQWIVELDSPPNSALTVALKGSANPLIDTGEMKNAVTYESVQDLPDEGLL